MRLFTAVIFALFSFVMPTSSASAQGLIPGDSPRLRAACLQWLEEHPDFEPIFGNLPPICLWHYAGWDCEQDWTPAGWLRPRGLLRAGQVGEVAGAERQRRDPLPSRLRLSRAHDDDGAA